MLFHVDELSYRDIATVLDVPIGTVMTWLHRGRARLKRALDDDADALVLAPLDVRGDRRGHRTRGAARGLHVQPQFRE